MRLWLFVRAIWTHWIGKMSGVFGLAWTVLLLFAPAAPASIFGWLCAGAFFTACFLAWEEQHRKAKELGEQIASKPKPYSDEDFLRVKGVYDSLSDSQRDSLRTIAASLVTPADDIPADNRVALEKSGLVLRDWATAHYRINPEYSKIVPVLLNEENFQGQ